MTAEILKGMDKEQVLGFIRQRLYFKDGIETQLRHVDTELFKKEHRRFEMGRYDDSNMNLVNEFSDLGIYENMNYLFLNFYKGHGTLYYQYLHQKDNYADELAGFTTSEIIYQILKKTIL